MARLTHLTRESNRAAIVRAGIRPSDLGDDLRGVYAMPVLPDFFASHQWLRELRRLGRPPLVAVDFVIPDDERVLVGHYARVHAEMRAAEAAGLIMHADDPRGYEVLVPRGVAAGEVARFRAVPQVVGWRYRPDAHGTPPCPCPVCTPPGTFKARQIRGD